MKHFYLKTLVLFLLASSCVRAMAQMLESDGVYYNFGSDGSGEHASVVRFSDDKEENRQAYKGDIVIPPMVVYNNTEIPVTGIEFNAFAGCTEMTSLKIPYSITNINPGAFGYTPMTLQIEIDAANTTYDCRENCNAIIKTATNTLVCGFTNTVIPNSVEVIGEGAFQSNTEINVLNIPNGIRVIDSFAFSGCTGLTAVEIPASVRVINPYAFGYCTNLSSVTMPTDLDMLYPYAFDNTPWFTAWDAEQANGVVYWGTVAWYYKGIMPDNTAITIKEGTRTLMRSLFYNNKTLTSITIPASVKAIGISAFENCNGLKEVHISDIAAWCDITFDNWTSNPLHKSPQIFVNGNAVKKLVIPEGATHISSLAFARCNTIEDIQFPKSLTTIDANAFEKCSGLTSLSISGNVKSIGYEAFYGCSIIENLELSEGLESIGAEAFRGLRQLSYVRIPNSVTSIGGSAFSTTENLKTVDLPGKIKEISAMLFYNSGLTTIKIPNNVKSIGMEAFINCRQLESAYIPANTQFIGHDAFRGCSILKDVYNFSAILPTIEFDLFRDVPVANATLHVPASALEDYKNADQWKEFGNIVPLTEEEDVDGIESLTPALPKGEGEVSDLNGRKVNSQLSPVNSQLKKGIYIMNGKKVLMK